jgi:UDP-N-acetylmuramoyl-L-alanyl-D-glutamate--2,6-diaminopimelate ligase
MSLALTGLLARLPASTQVVGDRDVMVDSLEIDSRAVKQGGLFVALHGEHVDGHAFIKDAIAKGARVVVADAARRFDGGETVTLVFVPDTRRALSAIAAAFYHDPSRSLAVIGVTGTNGKTTTTHMISAILNRAKKPCGLIGTVGAEFGSKKWTLSNTTPQPPELQSILARMHDTGANAVAMEVSSHALALDRVEDVRFQIGVLTNVTRDHLDFHETVEAYAAAKRRLFNMAEMAVINIDDEHGERWAGDVSRKVKTLTYSLRGNADVVAANIEVDPQECRFDLDGRAFVVPMLGKFNISNALAALCVARLLEIDDEITHEALWQMGGVPGRMEYVGDNIVNAVVDYAHTPDALEQALWALREATNGVALVFGCGGDRDKGKRAEMGRIAAQHAKRIYVTSDNPRTEDPMQIIREIESGMGAHEHIVEPDRKLAIERAVDEAKPGEIVLIAGKGHEKYQIVGTQTLPFDDAEIARVAIRARRSRK